jgi:hypothetical protein
VALESGFSLGEPAGEFKELAGMMASECKGRVDEGIRLYESTVKVDAERRDSGGVEDRGVSRQLGILPL